MKVSKVKKEIEGIKQRIKSHCKDYTNLIVDYLFEMSNPEKAKMIYNSLPPGAKDEIKELESESNLLFEFAGQNEIIDYEQFKKEKAN